MLLNTITLKQLRMFAAIVRTGSMAAAAQNLNISAPAVSLQMQLLQEQVGLPLLDRSAGSTRPTDAGEQIMTAYEKIEVALGGCDAGLAGLTGGHYGSVSVGIISTAKYFAPRALATFARLHPSIELRLGVGNREEIITGLRHHRFDVTVMGRPPEELEVEFNVMGDHPHVIVAPPDHPLASRSGLVPVDLALETFVVREPGSGTRGLMERFFADAGLTPRVGMQIGSNETIKQAVIAGLGITFISGHTVDAEVATGRLIVLDVAGLPVIRQWYIVHLRHRPLMPAMESVRRFLTSEGCSFLPRL